MATPVHGDAAATPLKCFFFCLFLNIYLKNMLSRKKIIILILISTQGLEKWVQKVDLQRQNQLKTGPG